MCERENTRRDIEMQLYRPSVALLQPIFVFYDQICQTKITAHGKEHIHAVA